MITILAVGAAGKFTGLVIPALAQRGARVRRFVFSSVIHLVLSGLVNHAAKAVVEEAVLQLEP